jgi:ubiquinone/menaquinone biosynthesis C-methylase UbiE
LEKRNKSLNNRVCPWWLLPTFDNPLRHLVHRPEIIFMGQVASGDRVLDVGCGMGYFTIPLAKMVGKICRVTAIDIQPKMLEGLVKRAARSNIENRIEIRQQIPKHTDSIVSYDFCLIFWMLHEAHDQGSLLTEIHNVLRLEGKLMLVEPKIHVSRKDFERSLTTAQGIGFHLATNIRVWGSRAAVLIKEV